MKAIWSGNIIIGFINIPTKIYPIERRHELEFRLIHRECMTPIHYKKWCNTCNREVHDDEIARGYEIRKGEFVIIEDKELEAIKPRGGHKIIVDRFVNFFEIDPYLFDRNYVLSPDKGSEEAYAVLLHALQEKGKAALGRVIIRRKEFPAIISVYKDTLVLTTLHYPEDVIDPRDLLKELGKEIPEPKQDETELAKVIIEQMSGDVNLEEYKDEYKEAVLDLVRKKAEGKKVVITEEVSEEEVKGLMEALEATVKALKKKRKRK